MAVTDKTQLLPLKRTPWPAFPAQAQKQPTYRKAGIRRRLASFATAGHSSLQWTGGDTTGKFIQTANKIWRRKPRWRRKAKTMLIPLNVQ